MGADTHFVDELTLYFKQNRILSRRSAIERVILEPATFFEDFRSSEGFTNVALQSDDFNCLSVFPVSAPGDLVSVVFCWVSSANDPVSTSNNSASTASVIAMVPGCSDAKSVSALGETEFSDSMFTANSEEPDIGCSRTGSILTLGEAISSDSKFSFKAEEVIVWTSAWESLSPVSNTRLAELELTVNAEGRANMPTLLGPGKLERWGEKGVSRAADDGLVDSRFEVAFKLEPIVFLRLWKAGPLLNTYKAIISSERSLMMFCKR